MVCSECQAMRCVLRQQDFASSLLATCRTVSSGIFFCPPPPPILALGCFVQSKAPNQDSDTKTNVKKGPFKSIFFWGLLTDPERNKAKSANLIQNGVNELTRTVFFFTPRRVFGAAVEGCKKNWPCSNGVWK